MLAIDSITYSIGGRTIFDRASARVQKGRKTGLVGDNGSGKTTLVRLVTGELELEGGTIEVAKRCRIGTVAQEAPGGDKTPREAVLAQDEERKTLLKEAESVASAEQIAWAYNRLSDIDAYSAPAKAAAILSGLGFSESCQKKPLREFSGGWRMRVALAGALFSSPDLLILDEPTNHLDLESIAWLESYLCRYQGTLLMVSHDRSLLNSVVDNVLLVKDGKLTAFSGNYDSFERVLAERDANREAALKKQEEARTHMQAFVDRFRAKATKAKQAQSRLKMLEKMAPVANSSGKEAVRFRFPGPLAAPSPLVKLDGVEVGYETSRPVLSSLNLSIYKDDRIALLGANGNGKSTLAKLLARNLEPFNGDLVEAGKLVAGYFAQDYLEQLKPSITAFEQVQMEMCDSPARDVRTWLGRFGFPGERADVPVCKISGGEKTRLALSLVALARPNLMVLDEPTNHLDVRAREALIGGLNEFEGAIVLISHDRRLIEATCDQLWLVEDGTCQQFFGDLDDYKRELVLKRNSVSGSSGSEGNKRGSRKESRREAAMHRARIAPMRERVEAAERRCDTIAREKREVEAELAKPSLYETEGEEAKRLVSRLGKLERELEANESEWLRAQEDLEREA